MFKSKYKKIQLLGQGSFGAAYLVQQRGTPEVRLVAKEVRLGHLSEKEREATLAEAELLRQVAHPSIVGYVESFFEGTRLHIVMEYADGGDLAGKIRQKREEEETMRESRIMLIVAQLLLALQHIHARKILHRDLKPMNIFLTKRDEVKLGDFGVAKLLEGSAAGAQTQIGTPLYLAPEVLKQETYGTKSDLWSLGVVTYELAALVVPFTAVSLPAVAMRILEGDPDPLPGRYSEHLSWVTMGLLRKNPNERLGCGDLLAAASVQHYVQAVEAKLFRRRSSRRKEEKVSSSRSKEEQEAARQQQEALQLKQMQLQQQKELERAQAQAREDAREQYFRNRQVAMEAKRRAEVNRCDNLEPSNMQRRPSDAGSVGRRPSIAESLLDGSIAEETARPRMLERRGSIAAREEAERSRLEELERARLAAQEDRRRVKERMLAREAEERGAARQIGRSTAHDAQPVSSRDDTDLTCPSASFRQRHDVTTKPSRNRLAERQRDAERAEREKLQELERARVAALEDRRLARQRRLAWEAGNDLGNTSEQLNVETSISTTRNGSPKVGSPSARQVIHDEEKHEEDDKEPTNEMECTQLPENFSVLVRTDSGDGSRAQADEVKPQKQERNRLQELERARLEALEDRRRAKQWALERQAEAECMVGVDNSQAPAHIDYDLNLEGDTDDAKPAFEITQKPGQTNELKGCLLNGTAASNADDLSYSKSTVGVRTERLGTADSAAHTLRTSDEISWHLSESESGEEVWCGAAEDLPSVAASPREEHVPAAPVASGRRPSRGSDRVSNRGEQVESDGVSAREPQSDVDRSGDDAPTRRTDAATAVAPGGPREAWEAGPCRDPSAGAGAERARRESLQWLRSLERSAGNAASESRRNSRDLGRSISDAEATSEGQLAFAAHRALQSAAAVAATVEALWASAPPTDSGQSLPSSRRGGVDGGPEAASVAVL
eukprot:TRINITY_DN21873_c0_g1_i1.p1 TRINITY_DN21873_c0_g1~~TRINITY_DN21873_c0_g1_i1.p1  ORF type:complete len:954 (-),score=181.30 TRINITY_DN21873_c0_g1_i1:178-3039(-)